MMTSNNLKWIALIIMVIDHIAEFISGVPIWFHWIGRLSAPIFLFCCVWSFDYTRNRRKYLLRLYIAGVVMSFIQYFNDLSANIFRTLFSVCLILYAFELYKNKEKGKKYLFYYFLWQLLSTILSIVLIYVSSNKNADIYVYIIPALLGNIFNLEGGIVFVLLGLIFYLFKDDKRILTLSFIVYDIIYFFASTTSIITRILNKMIDIFASLTISDSLEYILDTIIGLPPMSIGGSPLFQNYQWMMIFSLFFLLLYNGKEGKKHKWFFYIFYPAHLVLLSLIFGVN